MAIPVHCDWMRHTKTMGIHFNVTVCQCCNFPTHEILFSFQDLLGFKYDPLFPVRYVKENTLHVHLCILLKCYGLLYLFNPCSQIHYIQTHSPGLKRFLSKNINMLRIN
jgi:hypothetical protein